MNRRTVLGGIGAILTAGCTYAPGGGDVRSVTRVPSPGTGTTEHMFGMRPDGTFLTAGSGRQWLPTGERGHDYVVATTATLVTRSGDVIWRFQQQVASDRIVVGDRCYLVTEDRILASEPIEPGDGYETRRAATTAIDWSLPRSTDGEPLAAAEHTLVRATADGIEGIRDGAVDWTRSYVDPVQEIRAISGGFLVHTAEEIAYVHPGGSEAWQAQARAARSIPESPETVLLREEAIVRLTGTGAIEWNEPVDDVRDVLDVTPEVIHVAADAGIAVHDAGTGSRRHRLPGSVGVDPRVVALPETAIIARGSGRVHALSPDGEAWRRTLSVDGADPLAGWRSDEGAAFLFSNGEIHELQPQDTGRPLLFSVA